MNTYIKTTYSITYSNIMKMYTITICKFVNKKEYFPSCYEAKNIKDLLDFIKEDYPLAIPREDYYSIYNIPIS